MDKKQVVQNIINFLGGESNIVAVTNCMTRLRVVVKNDSQVDQEKLKNAESVLGLVHDREKSYEVVVGPGNSRQFADICHEMGLPAAGTASSTESNDDWKANKNAIKSKQKNNKLKQFLKIIGDIFVPLIPGIIVSGLCAGFASLLTQLVPNYKDIAGWNITYQFLTVINLAFMTYITAWCGYRAAERFGATPILGGMLGMITSLSNIDEIAKTIGLFNNDSPLQSILRNGKGGVLAVICGVFLLSVVEKFIRKRMPASLDIVFTPLLSMIIITIPYVLGIMPALGFVSNGIVWVFSKACMSSSPVVRILVGYAASAMFLPLVASGMHHGLVALYSVQLQELGFITLYPALAMAGAGQVGAAIAIYIIAKRVKHKKLCSVISGALPAGFLGVGEPLIYGVTLPMGRPFLTAGLGAGFGGAFVMFFQVASTTWGPSGVLGAFVMTAGPNGAVMNVAMYLVGLLIAYVMSFVITYFLTTKKMVMNALGGIPAEVENETQEVQEKKETPVVTMNTEKYNDVNHGQMIQFGFASVENFEYIIKDPVGIHARPAGEIIKKVNDLSLDITIKKGDKTSSGKSVVELMMLGAKQGDTLQISVKGVGAKAKAEAFKKFLEERL